MYRIGIALEELNDQDYMTQHIKGYANIPKGAEVKCLNIIRNMYGAFMKVLYDGILYYVNPRLVKLK